MAGHSQHDTPKYLDSIHFYLKNSSEQSSLSLEEKLSQAKKANRLSLKHGIDSLHVKSEMHLANIYSKSNNPALFLKYSHKALKGALKIKDSSYIAQLYQGLGYFYYDKNIDTAYYYNNKAEKLFSKLDDKLRRVIVLYDIAMLQQDEKDWTASELTSVNALSILEQLKESDDVIKYRSYFYNNLGGIFFTLKQFDESVKYYQKSISEAKKLPNNEMLLGMYKNNLGLVYKNSGKHNLAIEYYQDLLENKVITERPEHYALLLDNYAHALFLAGKKDQLPNLFLKALKICDSIDAEEYTIIINQHLVEYYIEKNKIDSARYYAYRAKDISERYSPDDLLRSYALLSKVEEDSIAVDFYEAYVQLNDSLIENERATRNKFARIQFETDQIEQENIRIARERQWLLIISIVILVTAILIYIVITQRNKNKELQFIQEQQEANEEIYNLMLSQNETIEEARTVEKKRISQELHDGVLGRLFGTRLSLDSLNFNNTPEAVKTRAQYISELKTIEEDIRKVSHELNTDFVSGSGFIDIIKTMVETQSLAYGLSYDLKHEETINWDAVPNKTKIHLYRILQESLHNIYKHASATRVKIRFKLKNNVICLSINDNGSGFDVNKAKSGIGLKNMNSRLAEIDGKIEIASEKEKGTKVIIKVPIA